MKNVNSKFKTDTLDQLKKDIDQKLVKLGQKIAKAEAKGPQSVVAPVVVAPSLKSEAPESLSMIIPEQQKTNELLS